MIEPFEWIQARHVMEHFIPEGCVEIGQPHREAKERLRAQRFDHGVVRRKGKVVGIVACLALRDSDIPLRLGPPVRRPELRILMPETTPIRQVIQSLAKNEFQLVLQGKEIAGLVAVSDLNKHIVFSHFYSLLCRFEQTLVTFIKRELPSADQWRQLVSSRHFAEAEKHLRKAQSANVRLDMIHYLYFSDYMTIVGNVDAFLTTCRCRKRSDWADWRETLCTLRNAVAHPTGDLIGPRRSASELAQIQERLYEQIERAETLLERGVA